MGHAGHSFHLRWNTRITDLIGSKSNLRGAIGALFRQTRFVPSAFSIRRGDRCIYAISLAAVRNHFHSDAFCQTVFRLAAGFPRHRSFVWVESSGLLGICVFSTDRACGHSRRMARILPTQAPTRAPPGGPTLRGLRLQPVRQHERRLSGMRHVYKSGD